MADPFAEFEDWLIDGPAGPWPWAHSYEETSDPRSHRQVEIATSNAALLGDKKAWGAKIKRFEDALQSIGDALASAKLRARYIIRFDGHTFEPGNKSFSGCHFPCCASFNQVTFGDGDIGFDGGSYRDGQLSFCKAVFGHGQVTFSKAQFGTEGVDFEGARFGSGDTLFVGANFGGPVNFSTVDFGRGEVSFLCAQFRAGALTFDKATFGRGDVIFDHSKFGKVDIVFSGAQLGHANISFRNAELAFGTLWFSNLHVRGDLDCGQFKVGTATFRNTIVDGLANWSHAAFGSIPDFRQTKFDRSTEVARMTVPSPMIERCRSVRYDCDHAYERPLAFRRARDTTDVIKLRKLKAMALAANDHEKDGEFFAYEMMAKRGVEHTTFWQLLFNTIYWKVSFYGQSYLRPLAWLGASFATFAVIFSLMATPPLAGWNSLFFGIIYSFKNSLPFLGTLTRSVPSPEGHLSWFGQQLSLLKDAQVGPDWFTVLGTVQAMLSLFFFFFLLLGLRNKFRLK